MRENARLRETSLTKSKERIFFHYYFNNFIFWNNEKCIFL